MVHAYGIRNCQTMKKALQWLQEQGVEHQFHDYKKEGIDRATLEDWEAKVGWETLLNRRGMMWRKVPQEVKDRIDRETALELMKQTPSIIKRPVLVLEDGRIQVGFDPEAYAALFP